MTLPTCQSIDVFPAITARQLTYFFHDIDDTLSTDGQISSAAFSAIWDLHRAGIHVVPVTGRPAGWCDHIARMWPVTAVIGENGAFYFAYDRQCRKMIREYLHSTSDQEEGRRRLAILREQVIRDVPGCAISADQPFRISDLAIDFREDVEPLSPEAVHSICSLAHNLGLIAKISSIHVNCWFGQFDKITCLKHLLVNHFNQNPDDVQDAMTYIGDSPNDAPAFAHIRHSIAVANIRPFLDTLAHKPRYITRKTSGAGFCEAVETILAMRQVPDITG